MNPDIYNQIKQLIEKLNYYTKFYDEGHPIISDKEWDDMYFELVKLENESHIYLEDSPTQNISYSVVNKLNKIEHSHPMLSLDKTKSINDIIAFLGDKYYVIMAKMDGLTCSLHYKDGRLIGAETRGNGIVGEDILHNALQVKNIPNKINTKRELVIDGEIICTKSDFEPFANEYKNPRNFASGSIRLLNSEESAARNLSFIAWDCVEGLDDKCNSIVLKFLELKSLGFDIVPFLWTDATDKIEKHINIIKNECEELGYPIDGLVFKYMDCAEYNAAGRTDHHFKGGIAYKFYDEEYTTILEDIEWTMGRTGQLTPVAILTPIEIDGTEISRASLHNISIIKELGLAYYGSKVNVFKANQIIPQISEVIENGTDIIIYPNICPICGGETSIHKDNNSEVLYCDNPSCEGKLINIIDHFASKKGLDIKGLSKATIEKLLDWGFIGDRYSIYELKMFREQWIKKSGFGIASVDKILQAIEESKCTTLDKIIAAAGIPEIGSRVAKDLAKYYDSWASFRAETNFLQYDGIGEIMNNNLLNFDYTEMDKIVNDFLIIKQLNNKVNENNLEGKIFCITGKTHIFKNRTELSTDIESKGGKVVGSISSKVNYLINNDNTSTSAKNLAAQKAGIPIITEEEYLALNN